MRLQIGWLALLLMMAMKAGAAEWIDLTEQYIVNPSFVGNDLTTGWQGTPFGSAGPRENAEHYNKTYDSYQVITGLTPGRYRVSLQAFYRMGSADNDYYLYSSGDYTDSQYAKLYATSSTEDAEVGIAPASSAALSQSLGGGTSYVGGSGGWWAQDGYYIPNNMEAAYNWMEAGHYENQVEVSVGQDGVLRIGVRKETTIDSDWTCLDNWRLEYYGEVTKVTGITLNKTRATMVPGEQLTLSTTIAPANATLKGVTWATNNERIVTVDKNGVVTAMTSGQAKVTATAIDGSGVSATCTVTVTTNSGGLSKLVVSELQAANLDQTVDPSWNYGGWVELYNPGTLGVTLTGCWVSDDPQNLQKVHITQPTAIPAKGYKVLWFDHHDKYCPSQLDMKLDVEGATLYLSDPEGNLLLSQQYPPAVSRCSYARKALDSDQWAWSATPTPEMSNEGMTWADLRLPAPEPDQPTQVFGSRLTVCVNIPDGATLRYTTDGSTPTAQNGMTSADGLFYPTETTTYRFCFIGEGYLPSQVVTRTYILEDKTFDLPVISVVGREEDLYGADMGIMVQGNGNGRPGNGQSSPCNWNMDWDRTVNFEYINQEGQMAVNQETAMERCGGWSRGWNPMAFKIKANKQYELQNFLPYQFFTDKPYLKHKTLQIRNGGNDNTCRIKDPALQEIVRRSGLDIDYQAYQPVMHYINGRYAGVINMREPNNKHFVYANYGLDDNEIDQFEISPDSGYVQKCGTKESLQRWYSLAEDCEDDAVYDEIRQMVDIDEYCNYMAVEMYLGNWDWPQNNVKAFKPIMEGGKFRFVMFDLDGSFNTTNSFNTFAGKQTYTFDRLYGEPVERWTKEIELVTIFLNMLQNERFRKQFIDTYCLVSGSVFEPERCKTIINELANRVSNSQNIWNEVYRTSSTPWNTANSLISSLSSSRQSTMINTLKNYSPMQLNRTTAQSVTLSTNIPEARLMVNDLPVPTNKFSGKLFSPITFKAQAPAGYKFAGWRLVEGSTTNADTLVEQESDWDFYDQGSLDGEDWTSLNYSTSEWSNGQAPLGYFVGGDRYTNTYLDYGSSTEQKRPTYYFRHDFSLSEVPTSEDVFTLNYTIDDGFIVYVNGTEAGRYNMPSGTVTYDSYATSYAHGNPDTGSMQLDASLFRRGRNVIAVEVHNNAANSTDVYWEADITLSSNNVEGSFVCTDEEYEMPEGNMVLQAVYEEMTDEEKEEAGISTTPIVINEVSAGNSIYVNDYFKKDDWVELYNTTNEDIDLEGMYLTDRSEKPEKYQISAQGTKASTIIPAHGYKVIWCSKRTTDSELHANFKLDNVDGTVIRLMAADKSWADSLVYRAHNGDQSVGRYPDGGQDIYLMAPTIAKSNTLNTYAEAGQYIAPEDTTTHEDAVRSISSRNGGMSIAYADQQVVVKSEDNPNVTLNIYTTGGALVMARKMYLESGHERVGISMLPAGIYIARLNDSEGNECATKFTKK
ncbi:MAG: CotH kinase family protein [Bacteroidaceae bacterium]|nr:CotH kinase family protein [Bacteroidaceae bacterium]